MDLQLAYLAAPQSAAQANAAQEAPAAGQASAQAAFAAQVAKREETVEETQHAKGNTIRTNPDGQGREGYTPQKRRRQQEQEPEAENPLGLSGDGEHYIDFTA